MPEPIPLKAVVTGGITESPEGAIPVALYGQAAGTPDKTVSPNGNTTVAALDDMFRVDVELPSGTGTLRILEVGGVISCLLTDSDMNPINSGWSPSGVVVHQDLDMRAPAPPQTGTYTLQAVNGAPTWVAV